MISNPFTCVCPCFAHSEDARCEVSRLFNELKKKDYLTSTLFIKVVYNKVDVVLSLLYLTLFLPTVCLSSAGQWPRLAVSVQFRFN